MSSQKIMSISDVQGSAMAVAMSYGVVSSGLILVSVLIGMLLRGRVSAKGLGFGAAFALGNLLGVYIVSYLGMMLYNMMSERGYGVRVSLAK